MNRSNRHPADELGDLRADIRRLKAREAELRERFIASGATVRGDETEVIVRRQRRRVLLRDRLPPQILQDPRLYEERVTTTVISRPIGGRAPGDQAIHRIEAPRGACEVIDDADRWGAAGP